MLNANGLWTSESVKLIFMIFVIERDWQKGVSIRRNVFEDFCSYTKDGNINKNRKNIFSVKHP